MRLRAKHAGLALATAICLTNTGMPASPEAISARPDEIERFCSNIADSARDRRYVMQAEELKTLQQEIDKRMALLEEKRAEYESWMNRREKFIEQATENVVKIYSGMKPDAAAERLAQLDASLAAAILLKLEPRKSGVILNEMNSKAAATLTSIMVHAARRSDPT
jgi:flagellar motility protein MotE (MotC chaperone)